MLRDYGARRKSRLYEFSASRGFSTACRVATDCSKGHAFGRTMADPVRYVSDTQSSVPVLMNHDVAARQCGSEAHRFDL
jgi:hypothetical protein